MIYNKPLWSPNVLLMNVTNNLDKVTGETVALLKKMSESISLIGLYINHEYKEKKESQVILSSSDYSIYKETRKNEQTVPSRLLNAGAKHVYYIVPKTENYRQAFVHIIDILGYNFPIICISNGLADDLDTAATVEFDRFENKTQANRILIEELKEKRISFKERKFIIE